MPKAVLLPFALALVLLAAPAVRAGTPAGSPGDPAQIARLRAEMDAAVEEQSRQLLREADDPRDRADTALALGAIHGLGLIGEADPVKASSFYFLASELESAEADCALGDIHAAGAESRSGRIARDMDMALEYYRKAAVGGSVKAMLALGIIYVDGVQGVPKDSKKALVYFMDAASRGNPDALARLDPVIQNAKDWEARHPGKKASFPTSRERLIKPELARADRARAEHLDKIASHVYVELSRRVAAAAKRE